MEDLSRYSHSPAHWAVARRDYAALRRLIASLPRLAKAGEVNTEAESLEAELQADAVSTIIDRRDVPGRETPLHLAVRLRDPISAEILMAAGADWSLQNENGWSALQEAVCTREEAIALIIARHYQPLAWAKWCRRLPRIVASAARIRDFYMEITFHFESSVIPFIGRIAPSDTYRIWETRVQSPCKFSKLAPEGSTQRQVENQKSDFLRRIPGDVKKGKDKSEKKKKKKGATSDSKHESEYKKGLRPVLWLTPDFPLKTDELLPLLDILANKVKAVRRLRELLTTKLPPGTFPVKVAIPIVPTIRVLVTFTKFEELQPAEEFSTPLSSPAHFQDAKSKESEGSTSWISWMRGSRGGQSSDSDSHRYKDEVDPFLIPPSYTWVDANEKKRRMKAKKAKSKKHRKQAANRSGEGGNQLSEDPEE
ncbi:ankyrin repeat domain-containing protein 13B [Carica papaya]|uniref:ankyrin repeat domain-containing protein 13B n=1 Tax=Carica papaya TaxID=3649 RepID=UPI000B8CF679|nr:ankyrin repeat domain-containing protein 13B [Carica papaya]